MLEPFCRRRYGCEEGIHKECLLTPKSLFQFPWSIICLTKSTVGAVSPCDIFYSSSWKLLVPPKRYMPITLNIFSGALDMSLIVVTLQDLTYEHCLNRWTLTCTHLPFWENSEHLFRDLSFSILWRVKSHASENGDYYNTYIVLNWN